MEQVRRLGQGTLLAKMDIQSAYRIVPVHKEDRCLLGVKWRDQLYVDCALSFGLRSACKIFTSIADAVEWIASKRGAHGIAHYLDDYIVVGHPFQGSVKGACKFCWIYVQSWASQWQCRRVRTLRRASFFWALSLTR